VLETLALSETDLPELVDDLDINKKKLEEDTFVKNFATFCNIMGNSSEN